MLNTAVLQNIRPISVPDPRERILQMASLRGEMQNQQLKSQQIQQNDAEMKKQQKALQDAAALHDILAQGFDEKGDLKPEAIQAITIISPKFGMELADSQRTRQQTSEDRARKQAFENAKALEGQPGEEITVPGFSATPNLGGQQGEATPIDTTAQLQSLFAQIRNRQAPIYQADIPGAQTPDRVEELPHPAIQVPGGPLLHPQTRQQVSAFEALKEKTKEQAKTEGDMVEVPFSVPEFGITKGQKIDKGSLDNLVTALTQLRKPATPQAPRTVTTEQGVFTLNPDGTLGNRLGDRPAPAPKEPKTLPDLESAIQTTRSGLRYVDTSQFTGEARNALTEAANKSGIPAVSKETGDLLSEIDNARENLDYMNQTIAAKLAKDPTGRLYTAAANTIEKLSQSDPDLAAVGTYRSAAIQAMRAVAGAKGLRINRAEIEQAQENDIPKMTDTLPTAQAKLKNMMKFLDNAERAHVVRNRAPGAGLGDIDSILNKVFGTAPPSTGKK